MFHQCSKSWNDKFEIGKIDSIYIMHNNLHHPECFFLLLYYLISVFHVLHFGSTADLSFASILTSSASKGTRGSSWMATSFSFPLLLCSHSVVACSVGAEQTPGSLPETSARRSPPLPAHLRQPSEWRAIVLLAVIWWPHSTGRQSWEPAPRSHTHTHTHIWAHTHAQKQLCIFKWLKKS